ncbi:calpain-15 [Thecamonas trahens ATCC 50062]|uniref:Calpain-15 n=1 Tax=Thecamonas trahens ATCC 50062 TaxID=461836 RepID=A0A0L0DMY7_THETB|nr:calpain-15 [Thecamonas trahens ATCC 50062]KNC53396.1 calpain-15 [Thecamonas trahens ATCC 50062]|eukprot:XP_013754436.1 calpain-15 [Thecamonas trahens ATCC 50062]
MTGSSSLKMEMHLGPAEVVGGRRWPEQSEAERYIGIDIDIDIDVDIDIDIDIGIDIGLDCTLPDVGGSGGALTSGVLIAYKTSGRTMRMKVVAAGEGGPDIGSVELHFPPTLKPAQILLRSPPFKYSRKLEGEVHVTVVITPARGEASAGLAPISTTLVLQPSEPPVSRKIEVAWDTAAPSGYNSGSSASAAHTAPVGWACRRCTFVNSVGAAMCEACGEVRVKRPDGGTPGTPISPLDTRRAFPSESSLASAESAISLADLADGWVPTTSAEEVLAGDVAEAESRLMAILEAGLAPFADADFPPTDVSLYGGNMTEALKAVDGREKMWARPQHIRRAGRQGWRLFASGLGAASSQDIEQGALGDCWFLSALALVAERPGLLERIVLTPELNSEGVYSFRFCKDGEWRVVTVDDWLPVDANSGRLVYSQAARNQLWVPLVEKAYAKLHGSYRAIAGGVSTEALQDLTGAPTLRVSLETTSASAPDELSAEDPELLWGQLLSWHESGYLVALSCGRHGLSSEVYQSVGLNDNHAYSLLQLRSVGSLWLMQIRNPWGGSGRASEWRGDWSDHSALWTAEMRRELEVYSEASEDGIFWMSFDDFLRYFGAVSVCMLNSAWHEYRVPLATNELVAAPWTASAFEVTVAAPTWVALEILQASDRQFDEATAYAYIAIGVLVAKRRGPGLYTVVGSVSPLARRSRTMDVLLDDPSAEYVVLPMAPDLSGRTKLTLALSSAHPVVIREAETNANVARRVVADLVARRGSPADYGEGMTLWTYVFGAMFFILVINGTRGKSIDIAVDASASTNMLSLRAGSMNSSDTLGPQTRMIVMAGTTIEAYTSWAAAYATRYTTRRLRGLAAAATRHEPSESHDGLFAEIHDVE